MATPSSSASPAAGRRAELLGCAIGAVAGLAFVVLNAGALGDPAAWVVRVVGIGVGVALLVLAVLGMRAPGPDPGPATVGFTRGYWWIVIAEVVALFVGVRILAALDRPELGVGWVAIVVGVHFVGLGRLWRALRLTALGCAMTALGVAGLALGWILDSGPVAAILAGLGSAVALYLTSAAALRRPAAPGAPGRR